MTKAERYQRDREKNLAYAREYRMRNASAIKERAAGKHAGYSRRYREKNYERCLEMTQAWKDSNPEQRAKTKAEWQHKEAGRHCAHQHNRRAREKGQGGRLSSDLAAKLYVSQRGRCACCGESLEPGFHMDHIVPLALGGRNSDDNVQLLLPVCNMRKGARRVG
jgi:5-methylcytosine-specific restriction endonuclease McrA